MRQLGLDILNFDHVARWTELRGLIIQAQDTMFTVAESELLSPRLLWLADCHQHDSGDLDVVYCAMRTGASMLRPDQIHRMYRFLSPECSLRVRIVAIKMMERICEAACTKLAEESVDAVWGT